MSTRKTKLKNSVIAAKSTALPPIPIELLDEFMTGSMCSEAVDAARMAFKTALTKDGPLRIDVRRAPYDSSPSMSAASLNSTTGSLPRTQRMTVREVQGFLAEQ